MSRSRASPRVVSLLPHQQDLSTRSLRETSNSTGLQLASMRKKELLAKVLCKVEHPITSLFWSMIDRQLRLPPLCQGFRMKLLKRWEMIWVQVITLQTRILICLLTKKIKQINCTLENKEIKDSHNCHDGKMQMIHKRISGLGPNKLHQQLERTI